MADTGPKKARAASPGLAQRKDFIGSVARFLQRSYASDYIGLVLIILLLIPEETIVEPFHRMFSLDNLAIHYPHAEVERVSPGALLIYAGLVPLGVLTLWAIIVRPAVHKVHVTFLGLFISVFLTILLTNVIKNAVGRPRPDLIARCKPAEGTPEHELVTIDVCTETDHHILHDGWRSFPSGHSSFAFAGLGYLAFFFAAQLHTLHPGTSLPAVLITLIPLLAALLIAISRCEDYRHDVWDVTAGSILGFLVAILTYRRYYPRLTSKYCETPCRSRADVASRAEKLKDEEDRIGTRREPRDAEQARSESEDEAERGGLLEERER